MDGQIDIETDVDRDRDAEIEVDRQFQLDWIRLDGIGLDQVG